MIQDLSQQHIEKKVRHFYAEVEKRMGGINQGHFCDRGQYSRRINREN